MSSSLQQNLRTCSNKSLPQCNIKIILKSTNRLFFLFRFKGVTLDFFISNLGFCLELGLLNSETEIGTGIA